MHFDIKNLNNMTKIRHDFESFLLAKFKNMLGVPYPVFTRVHLWLVIWIWTIGARPYEPLEPKVLV